MTAAESNIAIVTDIQLPTSNVSNQFDLNSFEGTGQKSLGGRELVIWMWRSLNFIF